MADGSKPPVKDAVPVIVNEGDSCCIRVLRNSLLAKISCISKTIIAVWNSDSAPFLLTVNAISPSKRSQEALLPHIVSSSSIVDGEHDELVLHSGENV